MANDEIKIPKPNTEDINSSSVIIDIPSGSPSTNSQGITIKQPGLNSKEFIVNSSINLFGLLANGLLDFVVDRIFPDDEQVIQNQINQAQRSAGGRNNGNESVNRSIQNLTEQNQFAPDAIPDGKGGFKPQPNGYWNGKSSSSTGLPVMSSLTFVGTTYTSLTGQQITIPDITFEMVMISMKKGKIIEKTDITGRQTGSVKENIGTKDWEIEIRAIIAASQPVSSSIEKFYQTGKYPEENMNVIDDLLSAPIAIQVICPYLNRRGVNYIIIDDGVQINQIDGEYEIQRIVIPCVSDNPLIIQIASNS